MSLSGAISSTKIGNAREELAAVSSVEASTLDIGEVGEEDEVDALAATPAARCGCSFSMVRNQSSISLTKLVCRHSSLLSRRRESSRLVRAAVTMLTRSGGSSSRSC